MSPTLCRWFLMLALLLTGAGVSFGQALLTPGDQFEMRLGGMAAEYALEYNSLYTVGDDGNITIPYVSGPLRAAGLTTSQFCRSVEKRLMDEKIFTRPTVLINLQMASRYVTVGGQVRAPQAIAYTANLTLSSAITRVGGLSEFGKDNRVKVTRGGKSQLFNLRIKDKDPAQNPKLLPGDEVEVL